MIPFSFYILLIIACLVAYLLNKQSFPSYFINFLYLFIAVIVFELTALALQSIDVNHNFLDHLYQPVEVTLLSVVYYHVIPYRSFKKMMFFIIPLFWMFCLYASVFAEGITEPNTISFIAGSIIIIFYSMVYLVQLFTEPPTKDNLLAIPFFWINTGHLFFYFGTFFQMGMDTYIRSIDFALAEKLVVINYALNFTLYLLYLNGFLCRKVFKL